MSNDIKIFGGIILATIVLIVGAVFFFGKDGGTSVSDANAKPVSKDLLVRKNSWSLGPLDAKVSLVEFGDFQCPACRASEPMVRSLHSKYNGKVLFVFRHFPLVQIHEFAMPSSLAAEAAGQQGKFWEMHDKLYDNQPKEDLSGKVSDSFSKEKLVSYAKDLGLDMDKFNSDIDSDQVRQHVLDDMADGNKIGVNATPTFFLNGKILDAPTLGSVSSEIDSLLK